MTTHIGHNNPPSAIDDALAPYGDYISEAENWLDGTAVENEAQMKAVDAILRQIKSAEKAVKSAEESEAKPIYDAWKAAKDRYKPTLDDLGRIKAGLVAVVDAFKRQLKAQRDAEERAAREAANAARRAAEDAARAASASDIEAQRAAAEALRASQDAQEAARKAASNKVKGMRTVTRHRVADHRAALRWIAMNDRDAITAFVDEYARRNHKAAAIDGVETWQEKEAF